MAALGFLSLAICLIFTILGTPLSHANALDSDIDDDFLLSLILPEINETCMKECSQKAGAMQANLSTKYPKHGEEIANFPLTAGFLADFCTVHRAEETCRSGCGNMSSVDPRLMEIVWSLSYLMCDSAYQRLTEKLSCLLQAKQAANSTCIANCNALPASSLFMQDCNRYSCIFDCEKALFDQQCGTGMSILVKAVRKHGWPSQCEE